MSGGLIMIGKRFKLSLVLDNNENKKVWMIIDNDGEFKNFYCINPSEEELENYSYLCECLNELNKDLEKALKLAESNASLKQRITNVLLEEIKDCEAHMKNKNDEFVNGRMQELKVLLDELVDV